MTPGIRLFRPFDPVGTSRIGRRARLWPIIVAICGLIGLAPFAAGAQGQGVALAVLGPDGADTPGDRISVTRAFAAWSLQCDLSVSQNKRLCGIEQILQRPDGAVLWRLARAADDRNVLIWSLPLNLNTDIGLTVKLDGFATTVSGWTCQTACLAVMPLSGTLQSLLFSATTVEMAYVSRAGKQIVLQGSMSGFRQAIQAAAEDPFGKRVPPPPSKAVAKSGQTTGSISAERARKSKPAEPPPGRE